MCTKEKNPVDHAREHDTEEDIKPEPAQETYDPCRECVEKLTGVGGEPCVGCPHNR